MWVNAKVGVDANVGEWSLAVGRVDSPDGSFEKKRPNLCVCVQAKQAII